MKDTAIILDKVCLDFPKKGGLISMLRSLFLEINLIFMR